jgi:peroxiredoxin
MPAVDAGREAEPQHVLTGKPAPLFNTTYLDGQAFDLAQHLGKEVVVLDFWATWCGPCRKAMPTLSEVTSEFNDRGVRLFAINLAEQTEDVKDFIEQSGLEIPVLMDPEGKIAEEYDAEAIPQTVLIDRQGVVRFVHVGLDPNLRQLLTEQLNTLVTESPGTSESTEAASR